MRNGEVVESPADVNLLTKKYTEETIKFIQEHKYTPFFIYLSHNMPHVPSLELPNHSGVSLLVDFMVTQSKNLTGAWVGYLKELRRLQLDKNTRWLYSLPITARKLIRNLGGKIGDAAPLRGGKVFKLGRWGPGTGNHALAR